MKLRSLFLLSLLATIVLSSGCATSPTGRSQLMLVSEAQAISASKKAYANTVQELKKEDKLVTGTALTRRVNRITNNLIQHAKVMRPATARWAWEVKVIDDPEEVNAWCMAGGKMAIYTGLLEKVKPTDDELAQVMGHEISHALANHTAERMSTAMATSLGVAVLGIATDSDAVTMGAATVAATLAIELPNSRAGESEADEIGIELAARAGYDPRAAVTLWQKMGQVGGDTPPQFLSTHPSPENRQQRLKALGDKLMPVYQKARSQREK